MQVSPQIGDGVIRRVFPGLAALFLAGAAVFAEEPQARRAPAARTVLCVSKPGERQHCPADTRAGVALLQSTGEAECLLGRTWGYDQSGVWVSDGCSGEFLPGQAVPEASAVTAPPAPASTGAPAAPAGRAPTDRIESWGEFEPGDGFLIGRSDVGELSVSAYALVRYVNQLPADETFTDHLGNVHAVDTRQDFFPHRVMVFLKGWIATPKLLYNIFFWTVNATDQKALFAVMGYQFTRRFSLYAGINGLPGTRSVQGSHPYWLAHDRVMADEFFRPYFGYGVWAQGEVLPGLWYNDQLAVTSSSLGVTASQLDRRWSTGASVFWMPTTREFGPRGAYGDWEMHEKVATRFGISSAWSPEERYTDANTGKTGNTTIRLVDSLNVFDTGSLAQGVTVTNLDYRLLSLDAGVKYRGFFLQTEFYNRWLDNFEADGPLPVSQIHDTGFYVQASFFPVPKRLEVYGATSQIFGDEDAGFGDSSEYLVGANFYPFKTRNHRLNLQVIDVNHSSVSSSFGYYIGGQTGTTLSAAFSILF